MKTLLALLLLAAPLRAELLATFQTTRGNIVVVLQYDKAPQTVANFITLAQGTRTRVDPLTGTVIRKPLYTGEKFYRTANNSFTKFAQTGSGTGNNNGAPGYTIRDEFHPSLTHVPYVLSMANLGTRHTGSSQIFFTGNITVSEYDNSYTIFGLVTDPSSRGVIDAIIAAGDNATTIHNVVFSRTDAAAIAFNEHAQRLPICSGVAGNLKVVPGVSVAYQPAAPRPGGTVFKAYRSLDLQTWTGLGDLYQGTGQSGTGEIGIGTASAPRAFFNVPLVTYQDALAPASLANRTMVLYAGIDSMTFTFNQTGSGGTFIYSAYPIPTSFSLVSYEPEPYKALMIANTGFFGGLKFDCVFDSETINQILGRNQAYQWNGFTWGSVGNGSLTMSK